MQRLTFLQTPPGVTDVYPTMLRAAAVLGGLTHFCMLVLFALSGVTALAEVNVASVLCYVLAAMLMQRGWWRTAMGLMVGEILAHGMAAVAVIGWESGFHFYLILILPVIIVNSMLRPWAKIASSLALGGLYVWMDWRWRGAEPYMTAPAAVVNSLHYFNLVATLVLLAVLATLYYLLVMEVQNRLEEVARTDPLTRLRNRRHAMEAAQLEVARMQRGAGPLALVLGDVDHFKRINDTHGHEAGDEALKAIADVLRRNVREIDHVARWGGEEFLVLLPGARVDEALAVAERLREGVGQLRIPEEGGDVLGITLGVSVMGAGESFSQALQRADRAMYDGKAAGRNRVVLASTPPMSAPHEEAGAL